MKKFKIVSVIFTLLSTVKKEGKKLLPVLLIIVDIILIFVLFLYILGNDISNSNSIFSTIANSKITKITPYSSSFTQDGNIIEVVFLNDGDNLSLSLKGGSKSNTCEQPSLTAYDSNNQSILPVLGIIKSGEKFSIKWDCKNDVSAGSLYDGNLFFDYIQNGKKETSQFYAHGWYK